MSFEALRGELEALQKAMPQVADANTAAGAEGNGEGEDGEGEGEGSTPEVMGKSFSFQLADGTSIEAVDGTDLVKSLGSRLVATESALAKALEDTQGVIGMQTQLIKSLQDQVARLAGSPAGRRSVLTVTERVGAGNTEQVLEKSMGFKTGRDAMNAAESAYKAGRISSTELAKCEGYVGRALQFPADLAAKVAG